MAKKQETKKVEVETPQVEEKVAVKTAPVVEQPKPKKVETKSTNPEDNWEIKDRSFCKTVLLLGTNKNPFRKVICSNL